MLKGALFSLNRREWPELEADLQIEHAGRASEVRRSRDRPASARPEYSQISSALARVHKSKKPAIVRNASHAKLLALAPADECLLHLKCRRPHLH